MQPGVGNKCSAAINDVDAEFRHLRHRLDPLEREAQTRNRLATRACKQN